METVLKTVGGDESSLSSNLSSGANKIGYKYVAAMNKEAVDIGCKLYYWSFRWVRTLNTCPPLSLYILFI